LIAAFVHPDTPSSTKPMRLMDKNMPILLMYFPTTCKMDDL
jgi:hypothetical protein